MKAIVCEMCGSQEFAKMDGMYICQHCHTKYDPEEAKKLMVEISGKVEIDRSKELDNLFKAARNARSISDNESALIYYQKISTMIPDNWEAMFYSVILRANTSKAEDIDSAATSVANCLQKVFKLIRSDIDDTRKILDSVKEVVETCKNVAIQLDEISMKKYRSELHKIGSTDFSNSEIINSSRKRNAKSTAYYTRWNELSTITKIMYYCGNSIEIIFDIKDPSYSLLAVSSWKCYIDIYLRFTNNLNFEPAQTVITKIKKYDPLYKIPMPMVKKRSNALGYAIIIGGIFLSIIIWLWFSH